MRESVETPRGRDTAAAAHPHLFSQDVFRGILRREHMRSERTDRPFGLLLIGLGRPTVGAPVPIWRTIGDVLAVSIRDVDIVGWYEDRSVIGVVLPPSGVADLRTVAQDLQNRIQAQLNERLGSDAFDQLSMHLHFYGEIGPPGRPTLTPSRLVADMIKRGLDIIGSVTLLFALAPLLLLIAVLVKLGSRGPVFFRQVRIGHRMKPFPMLKFRTMHVNADPRIHQEFVTAFIKAKDQASSVDPGAMFKLTNDPRITPVGRHLRGTSLDELPQLWNVVKGEMSLVGPRPPLPYELEQYRPWHRRRVQEAKPGITGPWQVAGRSLTTFDDMVRLDLRYAKTRSLWTDIKILLATPAAVISGKGAC
jgi:lipopolysaccharide/colanic/teichoic acid biosynthesis glycosyltransferase